MDKDFDIRQHEEAIDAINAVIRGGNICEVKLERRTILTVIKIDRKKVHPPRE